MIDKCNCIHGLVMLTDILCTKFRSFINVIGNSGDKFEDLSEGIHSILIQFTPVGLTQSLDCLNQYFTISRASKLHG